jgi:hypothetical protein
LRGSDHVRHLLKIARSDGVLLGFPDRAQSVFSADRIAEEHLWTRLRPPFLSTPPALATAMPKILTSAMRAHLDQETTQLAAIWRITRKDGQQFFFTDHDRDIVFGGDTYRADAGFERTAIRSDAGFAVDNLELVGVFAEGGIVEDEVRAGLFDGAEIRVSFVNRTPTARSGCARARSARRG